MAAKKGTVAAVAATADVTASKNETGSGVSPASVSNFFRSNPRKVCVFFLFSS